MSSENNPVYFFREYETPYGPFSQWYADAFVAPSAIPEEPDITFVTAEQYTMYRKAMLFNDVEIAEKIMRTIEPKAQKALGRKVKNFDGGKWDPVKEKLVEDGNYYKFGRSKKGTEMKELLLSTADRELVEASPYDRIWGIGFGANKAEQSREAWGQNLLGKAMMRARARLREEDQTQGDDEEGGAITQP